MPPRTQSSIERKRLRTATEHNSSASSPPRRLRVLSGLLSARTLSRRLSSACVSARSTRGTCRLSRRASSSHLRVASAVSPPSPEVRSTEGMENQPVPVGKKLPESVARTCPQVRGAAPSPSVASSSSAAISSASRCTAWPA